jgi:metal-dependent hydrolase (beta-lactamase superfamily II)
MKTQNEQIKNAFFEAEIFEWQQLYEAPSGTNEFKSFNLLLSLIQEEIKNGYISSGKIRINYREEYETNTKVRKVLELNLDSIDKYQSIINNL